MVWAIEFIHDRRANMINVDFMMFYLIRFY
jgi:hypothetical protein